MYVQCCLTSSLQIYILLLFLWRTLTYTLNVSQILWILLPTNASCHEPPRFKSFVTNIVLSSTYTSVGASLTIIDTGFPPMCSLWLERIFQNTDLIMIPPHHPHYSPHQK